MLFKLYRCYFLLLGRSPSSLLESKYNARWSRAIIHAIKTDSYSNGFSISTQRALRTLGHADLGLEMGSIRVDSPLEICHATTKLEWFSIAGEFGENDGSRPSNSHILGSFSGAVQGPLGPHIRRVLATAS